MPASTWIASGALAGLVAAAALAVGGCGLGLASAIMDAEDGDVPRNSVDASGTGLDGGLDDAAQEKDDSSKYEGSPLCNASRAEGACFPDDGGRGDRCGMSADGGALDGAESGDPDLVLGCHLNTSPPSATFDSRTLSCTPAGPGTDGAPCHAGTDCAAGYECVGAGQCQHYCCFPNSCAGLAGGKQFCDVQPMLESTPTKVPVCMPVVPCTPLGYDNNCRAEQTCALVDDDGTRGCVAVGTAKAGESCIEEHCARDLTCLGPPNDRRCYQLCHTDNPYEHCGGKEECVPWPPLSNDPSIGICQETK